MEATLRRVGDSGQLVQGERRALGESLRLCGHGNAQRLLWPANPKRGKASLLRGGY